MGLCYHIAQHIIDLESIKGCLGQQHAKYISQLLLVTDCCAEGFSEEA